MSKKGSGSSMPSSSKTAAAVTDVSYQNTDTEKLSAEVLSPTPGDVGVTETEVSV